MTSRQHRRSSTHRIRGKLLMVLAILSVLLLLPGAIHAQDSISEITVIAGGSGSIPPPPGYTKIPIDLNQDAGGAFIFFCYKKGVGAPITALAITVNSAAPPSDAVYTRVNVDLNQGAGGDFIWLWYSKDPSCSTIHNIEVLRGSEAPTAGYTKIPTDLNQSVGGAFIYLSYQEL